MHRQRFASIVVLLTYATCFTEAQSPPGAGASLSPPWFADWKLAKQAASEKNLPILAVFH